MPARRIRQLGDPVLREVSRPVAFGLGGLETRARAALDDLRDTLHEFQRTHGFGRGISAVQIGEPLRLIYIEFEGEAYSLVNPEFESRGDETFTLWDDCFSFPDLMVRLDRFVSVRLRYQDEAGQRRSLEASWALSELLQHEMDHLDGVLAVDHAAGTDGLATREEWLRRYRTGK